MIPKPTFLATLLAVCSMYLVSCKTYDVVIVTPLNYKVARYEQRIKYLGALHEANMLNYTAFTNGKLKGRIKVIGGF